MLEYSEYSISPSTLYSALVAPLSANSTRGGALGCSGGRGPPTIRTVKAGGSALTYCAPSPRPATTASHQRVSIANRTEADRTRVAQGHHMRAKRTRGGGHASARAEGAPGWLDAAWRVLWTRVMYT